MNLKELHQLYSKNYRIDTDTRNIRKDSIFFALKGERFNGNHFAKQALEKGAAYCVIDEKEFEIPGATILVEDVLNTLQELARYHRRELGIPIIGITGSNGKTTTKELINAVLQTQFKTSATEGNLNNHIGVPLTLLSFSPDIEIGIVEMGANHQKEIEFLCSICEPDIGYITNFGKAHLEGFGGIEGVIKGKSELYAYLRQHQKTVLVNTHDPKQIELTQGIERFELSDSVIKASEQPFLEVVYQNQHICTKLVGAYNLANINAAISMGDYFQISLENIIAGIENYAPSNNRSQLIKKVSNALLMDAYNANPSSTKLALQNFNTIEHHKKVVILGDMFELGESSIKEHQNIVDFCENLELHRLIFVGKHYAQTTAKESYTDLPALIKELTSHPLEDCFVLIKGSRGMALEKLVPLIP